MWDPYLSLLTVNGTMYRLVAMPPGTPQAASSRAAPGGAKAQRRTRPISRKRRRRWAKPPEYVSNANLNPEVRTGLSLKRRQSFMQEYVKRGESR